MPPLLPESAADALKELVGLATKLLGPGVEATGEIIADRLRLLRFQLQVRLLRKAEEIAQAEGFPRKAINGKVLFSLLQAADLEDNNDMQERWASLLASAINANNKTVLEPSFIEILKQLTPSHAYLLERHLRTGVAAKPHPGTMGGAGMQPQRPQSLLDEGSS